MGAYSIRPFVSRPYFVFISCPFSLSLNDRPISEDDSVCAVETAEWVCVPGEPRAIARDDVPRRRDLPYLVDCLVGDPDVHEARRIVEVPRGKLLHCAEPKLTQLRASFPDVAPAAAGRDGYELLKRSAALERSVVVYSARAELRLLELRAVGERALPASSVVRRNVPLEVHAP